VHLVKVRCHHFIRNLFIRICWMLLNLSDAFVEFLCIGVTHSSLTSRLLRPNLSCHTRTCYTTPLSYPTLYYPNFFIHALPYPALLYPVLPCITLTSDRTCEPDDHVQERNQRNRQVAYNTCPSLLYAINLYCTVLHCTALHCTALHCTALHCPVQYRTVPCCTVC
jgi:hypothetical protein